MLRVRFLTIVVLIVVALLPTNSAMAQDQSSSCIAFNISNAENPIHHSWESEQDPCVEIINDTESGGSFVVDGGWLFGTAVVSDGSSVQELEVVPPTPPDTAQQVVGGQRWELAASEKLTITLTAPELPALPEIGLWFMWEESNPACQELSITEPDGLAKFTWPDIAPACLEVRFPELTKSSTVEFSGWVFGGPVDITDPQGVTSNLETYKANGEAALQIKPLTLEVDGNSIVKFAYPRETKGRELGLRWVLREKAYVTYLPTVRSAPQPMEKVVQVNSGLHTYKVVWPIVAPDQETCAVFRFGGGKSSAEIVSGWFFDQITSSTLNGTKITIPRISVPGEQAQQLTPTSLNSPQNLTICLSGEDEDRELGIAINY